MALATPFIPLNCSECGSSVSVGYYNQTQLDAAQIVWTEQRGLGVGTLVNIPARTLVETAPVFVIPPNELETFHHIGFESGPKTDGKWWEMVLPFPGIRGWERNYGACVPLGKALIFNHSKNENVNFWFRETRGRFFIDFWTVRDVQAEEELVWCYREGNVWFPET
jgi:hypothetical protein